MDTLLSPHDDTGSELGFRSFEFRASWFRVWGLGFRIWVLEIEVYEFTSTTKLGN